MTVGINKILITILFSSMALALIGCASIADKWLNDVTLEPPYKAGDDTQKLHTSLNIIDLHADPLLWNRDLLSRNTQGHADLPRLLDGNVTLMVCGVVTGVPFPLGLENNKDGWDVISLLASMQDWPDETHDSRLHRAIYQANKLKDRVAASEGAMRLVYTGNDITSLMSARQQGKRIIGTLLSLEGAHALEGNPDNISTLYDAGFRMLGLVHLFDNEMAGSAHGVDKHGLTDNGRTMVQRALSLGMIIDLAHASANTIDEVLAITKKPVIASHGGVRGTCDTARNLADRHIRSIAATGGVIGIGIYEYATCGKSMQHTVAAMRYVTDLVGIEHVALGTDFDGATETMVDASGLVLLTEALLKGGFSKIEIKAIMGGNALRVFHTVLPES